MDWSKEYRTEHKVIWEDVAQTIRETVTMDEVLDLYAPGIPRRNHRMPCPIHDGKDPNFSYTRTGYRCFVCGASGDVITFVKVMLSLATRGDAMKRLNADLHLNIPLDSALTVAQNDELVRRRAEAERKRKAAEDWKTRYHSLLDAWIRADIQSIESDPLSEEHDNAELRKKILGEMLDALPAEPR